MTDTEKVTNHDKKSSKKYRSRKLRSQQNARDTTLSIRTGKIDALVINTESSYINSHSTTDLNQLKDVFFTEKNPLPYEREHPLKRLIMCQHILQTEQTEVMKSFPFVLRLSHELMELEQVQLKRKIRAAMKSALGEVPLYWITFEHNVGGIRNKHVNGEILINQQDMSKLRKAFRVLYGENNKGVGHAIRFPTASRVKQAQKYGAFYATYNWCGYATKEHTRLTFEQMIKRYDKNALHSISSTLNSKAKARHRII